MADTTIDRVQIEIEATAKGVSVIFTEMEAKLQKLQAALDSISVSKLNQARSALNGGFDMSKMERDVVNAINKVRQGLAGLDSIKKAALGGDSSAATSFSRQAMRIQSQIDIITEKLKQLGENRLGASVDKTRLEAYREELYKIQEALNASKVEVGNMPSADTKDAESGMDRLKSIAANVKDAFIKMANGIKSAFSNIANTVKKVHGAISGMHDKISSFANKGFMRVLKYAFGIRSLYVLFRRLRKAVVESFGELQNSGAFFQTTRANIESLKASLTTLKFQFGAAFEPIFNAVAPALQKLVDYLITVMNVISAFTAKLMGKSTYSKAVANMGSLAKNTGGAAKAQKELNKQLQSFDELNNLTTNNGGGGGGGAGGGGSTAGANYVEESVDSVLGDFGKKLAELIKNGDWFEVGKVISEKLSEIMESIPWDKIFQKAKDFGKGLAEFLNGLISPELFADIGKTLANALNTVFKGLKSFGEEFEWTELGESIAAGINEWFSTAEFKEWGETIHTWLAGLLDAGIALLEETDFEQIGTKIGDFLAGLDIKDLATKLKKLAKSIIKALGDAIKGLSKSDVGDLELGLLAILGTLALTGSIPATITVTAVIAGIELGGKLYEVLSGNTVDQSFLSECEDIMEGLFGEDKIDFNLFEAINFIWEDLTGFNDKDAGPFERALRGFIFGGQGDTFNITMSIKSKIDEVTQSVKDFFSGGKDKEGKKVGFNVDTKLTGAIKKLKDFTDLKTKWTSFKTTFKDVTSNVKTSLGGAISKITDLDIWKEKYNGLKESWNDKKSEIKTSLTGAFSKIIDVDSLKTKYTNLKDTWTDKAATLKASVGGAIAKITDLDTWKSKFDGLKTMWADKSASLKASVGGALKSITDLDTWKTKMSNLRSTWADKAASLKASLGGAISNIGTLDTWKSKMSSLQSSWVGRTATFVLNQTGTAISTLKDKIQEIVGFWKDRTATFKLAFTTTVSDIKSWINNNIINPLNSKIHSVSLLRHVNIPTLKAQGGVTNKATNTIWGESGAEALIPLEHNLKGVRMIASTMLKGMADVSQYRYSASPSSYGFSGGISSYNGGSESALMAEQNRLLAEQNQLLRQIAAKDVSISSGAVFNAVQNESNSYYNRTGNSPFVF